AHVDHVCPPVGGVDHAVENRAEGAVVDVAADLHGHERRPRRDSSRAHRVAAHGCSGVRAVEEQIGVDLFAGEVLLNRIGLGERHRAAVRELRVERPQQVQDRKSTRLNSSHVAISYAVFCLKKKKKQKKIKIKNTNKKK